MKITDVSVGVQEVGGELIVLARFRIATQPLEREEIPFGSRVKESARRQKEKRLAKVLESLEFSNVES